MYTLRRDALTAQRLRYPARGSVVSVLAIILLAQPLPAYAHTQYGQYGPDGLWEDCSLWWSQSHNSSSIEAASQKASALSLCSGMEVKVRYKVDGQWYWENETDTLPPVHANVVVSGWDIFYFSDHNGRPSGETYWVGDREYH